MKTALRVSEAASLALHAMALLAHHRGSLLACNRMASQLNVSAAHLSKVLQRLAKQGLVTSARGPQGGFSLARNPSEVSLLEVCEAIEGPLQFSHCLFDKPLCDADSPCLMGSLLSSVDEQVARYLRETTLADLLPTELAITPPQQYSPAGKRQE